MRNAIELAARRAREKREKKSSKKILAAVQEDEAEELESEPDANNVRQE